MAMSDDRASVMSARSPGVLDTQESRHLQAGRRKGLELDVHV